MAWIRQHPVWALVLVLVAITLVLTWITGGFGGGRVT